MNKFWSRVNKTDGCWLWTGKPNNVGYGQLTFNAKPYSAHRFSWELANQSIPKGMSVLHRCDNRLCVRPDHMFLGTQRDNMKDMINKNRSLKGELSPTSKLTNEDVKNIRKEYATGCFTNKDLSTKYSVDASLISLVVLRKAWKHI